MTDEAHVAPLSTPAAPSKKGGKPGTDWFAEIRGIVWLVLAVLGFHSFIAKPFYIPSESMMPGLLVGDRLVVTKFPYGYSFVSPTFHLLPFMQGRLFGSLPKRGDVVIVTPPGTKTDYIKRVIGLPGDTIALEHGTVILNGVPVRRVSAAPLMLPVDANAPCDEDKFPGALTTGADGRPVCRLEIMRETLPNGRSYDTIEIDRDGETDNMAPVVIPQNAVFLMGDNRDRSADSRVDLARGGLGGPVPWENLGGRAEFITFSLDGSASFNPLTWPASFRSGRAGASLHPTEAAAQ